MSEDKSFLVGQVGVIVKHDPVGNGQDYLVCFPDADTRCNDQGDPGWWCTDEEIEKVTPDGK
jgi:hypothetical protein